MFLNRPGPNKTKYSTHPQKVIICYEICFAKMREHLCIGYVSENY